jgi:Fic family protein
MTPICFPYFAGNYRGDARFKCLRDYQVGIPSDGTVGTMPHLVASELATLKQTIEQFINALEGTAAQGLSAQDRMIYIVQGVSFVLAEFLRIHPYANGNGHMGRFTIWALLLRLGVVPQQWPLEERPPDPPYSSCLQAFRQGQPEFLWRFMLACITG